MVNKTLQCLEIKFNDSVDEALVDEVNNAFMDFVSYYEHIVDELHYSWKEEKEVLK